MKHVRAVILWVGRILAVVFAIALAVDVVGVVWADQHASHDPVFVCDPAITP